MTLRKGGLGCLCMGVGWTACLPVKTIVVLNERVHPGSKQKAPWGTSRELAQTCPWPHPLPIGGLVSTMSLSPKANWSRFTVPLGRRRWGPAAAAGRSPRPETHPGCTEEATVAGEQTGLGCSALLGQRKGSHLLWWGWGQRAKSLRSLRLCG